MQGCRQVGESPLRPSLHLREPSWVGHASSCGESCPGLLVLLHTPLPRKLWSPARDSPPGPDHGYKLSLGLSLEAAQVLGWPSAPPTWSLRLQKAWRLGSATARDQPALALKTGECATKPSFKGFPRPPQEPPPTPNLSLAHLSTYPPKQTHTQQLL